MNVSPLPHSLATDAVPLERLNGNSQLTESEKIAEVSRQFEALLLRQILSETQKPLLRTSFTDDSFAGGIYRDMISNQLAESIAKSGTLGLASSLERQLDRQIAQAEATENSPTAASAAAPASDLQTTTFRPNRK